jgi:hypothetical protein
VACNNSILKITAATAPATTTTITIYFTTEIAGTIFIKESR